MNIKSYLAASSRTLTDFANAIGTSTGHMHDLANGRRTPSLRLALKIINESGGQITIDDLSGCESSVKAEAAE